MPRMHKTLAAWGSPGFEDTFRKELAALGTGQLPLQQGLTISSHAGDRPVQVMVLHVAEQDAGIRARVGIFFTGIVAGCSCADDPTPVDEQQEYCELQVDIDRATAQAAITLLP